MPTFVEWYLTVIGSNIIHSENVFWIGMQPEINLHIFVSSTLKLNAET